MACCLAWWVYENGEGETTPLNNTCPAYVSCPDPNRIAVFREACKVHAAHPCQESRRRMDSHIREACLAGQPPGQYVTIRSGHHQALAEYVETIAGDAIPHHMIRSYLMQ